MAISIRSSRPAAHNHSEADQVPVVAAGVAPTLKTHMYIGDETETSSTSTSDEKIKTFTLVKDPNYGLNISTIKWQVEAKNSVSNGTTTWTMLIDTTSTVGTGTVVSMDYILSTGSSLVSLTTGTHPMDFFLKTTSGGTAYTRLFECYGNIG